MLVGVPKEIKNQEFRVGLSPMSVEEIIHHGHQVLVETQAGIGVGFSDADYEKAGATILNSADEIFSQSEMIVKVKEPQSEERSKLQTDQILFTYLHLAPDSDQTQDLIASGATCIAYETVTDRLGRLPLLTPMSQVAGRMSIQAGARCLEKSMQGRGVLLGGVSGVEAAKVVIVGGGVVGQNAAAMAVGLGAEVFVLDRSTDVLRQIDMQYGNRIHTIYSNAYAIDHYVGQADLVVGSILLPGAQAPKLITRSLIKKMHTGSVFVDVAIDQGGCSETSKPTTHDNPTYPVDDVVHYCVTNMPGAVPRTSTLALNNVTLPFILNIANKGVSKALSEDEHLLNGLNIAKNKVTCSSVAHAQDIAYTPSESLLNSL